MYISHFSLCLSLSLFVCLSVSVCLSICLSLSLILLFNYMLLFVTFPGELHGWILHREARVHDKDVLQAWQALATWVPPAVVETSLVSAVSLWHHPLSTSGGSPVIVITSDRDHHWLASYDDSIYSLWMWWLIGKWNLFQWLLKLILNWWNILASNISLQQNGIISQEHFSSTVLP